MKAYQLNAGGTPARLKILRSRGANWREARHWTLETWRDAFCAGLHASGPGQWHTNDSDEHFRNERFAHEIGHRLPRGWFTDTDGQDTAIGIVAGLSHGRYIAGYRWTSNGERVYFAGVFDNEIDAARMADEHARVFAELAREDAERYDAMREAEDEVCALIEEL
jgi:hypothetical protein